MATMSSSTKRLLHLNDSLKGSVTVLASCRIRPKHDDQQENLYFSNVSLAGDEDSEMDAPLTSSDRGARVFLTLDASERGLRAVHSRHHDVGRCLVARLSTVADCG